MPAGSIARAVPDGGSLTPDHYETFLPIDGMK